MRTDPSGLLLTFGLGPDHQDGVALAKKTNERLRELFPRLFTSETVMKDYWVTVKWGSGEATGDVRFELYLIEKSCR